MKIYTKTGDKGTTSLVGGTRVPKTHVRLEAYGTVDELNANLGVLVTYLPDEAGSGTCPSYSGPSFRSRFQFGYRS